MAIPEDKVVAWLARHPGRIRFRDLARELDIPRREWTQLRRLLRRLQSPQHLRSTSQTTSRRSRPGIAGSHLVAGRLQGTRRGFAFLIREDGKEDVFIRADNLRDAVHGDEVRVRLRRFRGRLEGVVEEVTRRAREVLAGTLHQDGPHWFLIPDDDRVARDLLLSNPARQPADDQQGHKALARITGSDGRGRTFAELVEVLGPPGSPGVRMAALRAEFGLPADFDRAVREQVAALRPPAPGDLQQREDLSQLRSFTIDPFDAKDHDDAVSIERLPQGGFELGVHIADVSHYVPLGSAADREAQRRGTSVYLADTVVPMLPESLSNHLCSLRPGVARLTRSAMMRFDVEGNLLDWRLTNSWIVSRCKLSYQAAQALVDGLTPDDTHWAVFEAGPEEATPHERAESRDGLLGGLLRDLRDMAFLASRLRQRRFAAGALELETPEYVVRHDEQGRVLHVAQREALQSYSWIEEFMLMANQVVARSLARARLPLLWRIHEDPQFQGVEELRQFLRKIGIHWTPSDPVTHRDYQQLLKALKRRPERIYLMYRVLRSLQKARYDARHLPHFGLAFEQYTHFTSPIRRYPDLHNHRLVDLLVRQPDATSKRLPTGFPQAAALHELGDWLSEREVAATEAERSSLKLRVCESLVDRLGEEAQGWVSGISDFGLFIDIPEWGAEGLIHVDSLQDDHYSADPLRTQLRGDVSGRTFRFGQPLRVSLVRVDPDRRQIDLCLAS
jgi:ribonuclease R